MRCLLRDEECYSKRLLYPPSALRWAFVNYLLDRFRHNLTLWSSNGQNERPTLIPQSPIRIGVMCRSLFPSWPVSIESPGVGHVLGGGCDLVKSLAVFPK